MSLVKSSRIESIDILRGIVMVIMALDHVRDFFHYGSFTGDPTNLETTTPILFFTRFITHYCAPVFVFLAGTSAFLYGVKKPKQELFKFLFSRGIWLILLEIVLNNLLWKFDIYYSRVILQVIWAIGFSMFSLSFLIYLPKKILLLVGILIVFGHNALDSITAEGNTFTSIIWYALHQPNMVTISPEYSVGIFYPVLPWIGVMILGYNFGYLYKSDYDSSRRTKWLLLLGFGATVLFFIVRGINRYGDLVPWSVQRNFTYTILSFFNVTKYPPSLAYVLITLGPSILLLYGLEKIKNNITNFFLVFGRVPLFYYFLHIFVIHISAILGLIITGGNWRIMILDKNAFSNGQLLDYGYSLPTVYLIWVVTITILYFPTKKYMTYKAKNRDKWWLSYL
ncbi:DUF1624 domain-containing protein [Gaetbulibacter saemankumensis]|uniref:DUF1624 domain-containing protein n=1 Tax=Gaetbulibacter saemankumensis TaxID=311208 RepID=UPI0004166547|nr:heparan-alpha-glucosaminide N-acetyltransferase domain-containing protein [Gaetbulibacter saemankumensis]